MPIQKEFQSELVVITSNFSGTNTLFTQHYETDVENLGVHAVLNLVQSLRNPGLFAELPAVLADHASQTSQTSQTF